MSKLDELIAELCPDGVAFLEVGSVSKTLAPKIKVKSHDYLTEGDYPVIDQGQEFIGGYTNESGAFPKDEYVIFGDHTCVVKYVDFPFVQGADGVKVLTAKKDKILPKFLYYCMDSIRLDVSYARHWSKMKIERIPVPPLEVQREIVRVLDNFMFLSAELSAELSARRKQYEYYLERSMSTNDYDVEWMTIDDCTEKTSNIKWKTTTGQYRYIDLSSVDRETCTIGETTVIDSTNAPSRAQQIIHEDDVLFGTTRPLLKRFCIVPAEYDGQIASTGYCVLRPQKTVVRPKWIYYSIACHAFYNYIKPLQVDGSYPSVTNSSVKGFQIAVPPLEKQDEIISVLNRFDDLSTSISSGIPAEIEARQKQYEYYRDKLLTFREKA